MEIESQRRVEALDECHGPTLRVPLGTEFPSTADEGAEDRFMKMSRMPVTISRMV
jgi:hypothetical protein